MKFLVVILALVGIGAYADNTPKPTCTNSVQDACSTAGVGDLTNCNAKYGAITHVEEELQKFANSHIAHSFDYLLMSSHFNSYSSNREGFSGLFRKLSDSTWNDAIDLIKHLTKRGGIMNLNTMPAEGASVTNVYGLTELNSLAVAIDAQKTLAGKANSLHGKVTPRTEHAHDPELASFLENNFVHRHADSIRELSGYANDLAHFLAGKDKSLAVFLFDEYLRKA